MKRLLKPALQISRRFLNIIREYPFIHEEIQPKGKFTVSIGVSEFRDQSPEELLHCAEKALRLAKEKGRDRIEVV
ncbi:MAG: diguanylate cyclase domain-containing protein [Thermodesulfovibrionales bacterium]